MLRAQGVRYDTPWVKAVIKKAHAAEKEDEEWEDKDESGQPNKTVAVLLKDLVR
jgi:hypothetical protein